VARAERGAALPALGRGHDDDAIRGMKTVIATGNFLKHAIGAAGEQGKAGGDSFARFHTELQGSVLLRVLHGA